MLPHSCRESTHSPRLSIVSLMASPSVESTLANYKAMFEHENHSEVVNLSLELRLTH